MEHFIAFMNQPTFKVAGQIITVGQWMVVPIFLLVGILLTKWVLRLVEKRLTKNQSMKM